MSVILVKTQILPLVIFMTLIAMVPFASAIEERIPDSSDASLKIDTGAVYHILDSGFVSNIGQYDPEVAYVLQYQQTTVFFTQTGLVLAHTSDSDEIVSRDVIRQTFGGVSPDTRITAQGERPGRVNYYVGNDSSEWLIGIPVYAEIVYNDLYPGIDLVYAEDSGRLKREFRVSAGASPSEIELLFDKDITPYVDDDGTLRFVSSAGEILESPLICWQVIGGEVIPRSAVYLIEEGSVRIAMEDYNPEYELIIDPELVYSTFLGGSKIDDPNTLASDGSGGVWIVGFTDSTNFPVTAGAYQSSGDNSIFISRFSSTGTLLYSTYLGEENGRLAFALAPDGSGGVWVAGFTDSTNFLVTADAYQSSYGGWASDGFISRFSSTGTLLYSTYLGGNGQDYCYALAPDGSGGVWVAGSTDSTNFPVTADAYQSSYSGGYFDTFVSRFSSTGTLLYSTYLGGNGQDYCYALAPDGSGGVWVAGEAWSTNFPVTANAYNSSHGGGDYDAFVSRFLSTGTLLYSTYLGGNGQDRGNALAPDGSGGVWVAGGTGSTNFPVTADAYHSSHGGGDYDAFVSRFSSTGPLLYSTYLGGNSSDFAYALSPDVSGGVWVAGGTGSTNFPVIADSYQSSHGGGSSDAFVSWFLSTGTLLYSTYLGGNGQDRGYALASDGSGGVWVTGETESSNFPVTADAYQSSYSGSSDAFGGDAFVVRFSDSSIPPTISSLTPSTITAGSDGFTLEVTGTNFIDGAKVLWGGQERATVFVSTTKLTTTIFQSDVANAGTYKVTVVNPDGKESGEIEFTVTVPSESSVWKYRSDLNNSGVYDDGGTRPEALELWKFQTKGQVHSSPVVANGVVYFGGNENKIYALNADTGTQIWNFTTSGASWSSPAVANGVIYYGGLSKFYALNATTGALLWDFSSGQVESSPAVANGVVYFGSRDYKVYALNADNGNLIWSFSTGSYVQSSPAVADGVVYIASYDGRVYALNAVTGTKIWEFDTGDPIQSSPAVANGIVYIGSWNGKVHAINADSGSEVWNFSTLAQIDTSPAVADGVVYFGSRDCKIYSLSAETGTEIWTFNTGNEVISSPSFANGVVYIAAINRFYALNADTGIQIWNLTCGGGTTSSPAIANGLIYVGSQDTCLYAIGKISYSNPTIVSLSPSSITASSDAFTLEVIGTNFVDGAKVLWGGQEQATVFVSTTKLTATILQGDVANAGTHTVTVVNPNGVESGELHFEVTPSSSGELSPPPTILGPGDPSSPGPIIETLTPIFNWTVVPDADEYGLYIRNLNADTIIFDSRLDGYTITGNTFTLPSGILQPDTHYRWNMNSHSSAGWNDDLVSGYSQILYFATPSGTQPQALPVILESLTLSPGPYKVGDTISATYTIHNDGSAASVFSNLTVGGRYDLGSSGDGTLPDGTLPDFTHRSITLQPGESYNYQGELTLRYGGEYHFFCAYSPYSGDQSGWNCNVPLANPGIIREVDISVDNEPKIIFLPYKPMVGGIIEFHLVDFDNNEFDELEWDFGDNNKSNEINPSHQFNKPLTYEIKVYGLVNNHRIYLASTKLDLSLIPGDILLDRSNAASLVPGEWTHAAMYYKDDLGNDKIVEAAGPVSIDGDLSDWAYEKKTYVRALRVKTTDKIREDAIKFAVSKEGEPYQKFCDNPLKDVNGHEWYCSELVWAAYKYASNGQIDFDQHWPIPIDLGGITPSEIAVSPYVENIGYHLEERPEVWLIHVPNIIIGQCPIRLEVKDSFGNLLNESVNQIPNSSYILEDINQDGELDNVILLPHYLTGMFVLNIHPLPNASPNDTYSIYVYNSTTNQMHNQTPLIIVENVEISKIPIEGYTIELLPDQPISANQPPNGITNLNNRSYQQNYINWTWTDPTSSDFDHVEIYLYGVFQQNVTQGVQAFTATGLSPSTAYTIGTRTVGITGLINETWVNHTAMTASDPGPSILPPEADFNANITSSDVPLSVQFIDQSIGDGITNWLWSFGDGETSTDMNPLHIYTTPGTYTVSLQVTNGGGSNTSTKANYITATQSLPLVPDFEGTPLVGNAPLEVVFTDTSSGIITSRLWNFGDGMTVWKNETTTISHTYSFPGTYTVSLTSGNEVGQETITKTEYIQVNPTGTAPVARFIAVPMIGYEQKAVRFSDRSMGTPLKWQWDFGDGSSSSEQNPSHAYTTSGRFVVTLTVFNSGGSSSYSSTVWMRPTKLSFPTYNSTSHVIVKPTTPHNLGYSPISFFTMDKNFGSSPMTVQFSDMSFRDPSSWEWDFDDGETSTLQNPIHIYNMPGTYSVSLTVKNLFGESTTSRRVYVR